MAASFTPGRARWVMSDDWKDRAIDAALDYGILLDETKRLRAQLASAREVILRIANERTPIVNSVAIQMWAADWLEENPEMDIEGTDECVPPDDRPLILRCDDAYWEAYRKADTEGWLNREREALRAAILEVARFCEERFESQGYNTMPDFIRNELDTLSWRRTQSDRIREAHEYRGRPPQTPNREARS
jgi:hypothetical protein